MSRVDEVQGFIEALRTIRSPIGLAKLLAEVTRDMGFDNVTMFQHVDLSGITPSLAHMGRGDLVGITTAPVSWSEYYRDNNLLAVDPRVIATRRASSPFTTGQIGGIIRVTPAHRAVVQKQARAGIGEGFTIPVHFPGEPSGSCTFSMRCGRALPTRNLAMAAWIGQSAFQSARTMIEYVRTRGGRETCRRLTERQLQCTLLVGRGLSEAEIARRLGISYETVKRHLKEARLAYGVAKSVQLVTRSLQDGQITLRDLLGDDAALH